MWFLSAWKDAKEVWYQVVWEEIKESPNVIGYNIREEQTKDTFAIDNMNNQTTTWMADAIPWMNSPKLLATTSIIWGWWSASYCELAIWHSSTIVANDFTNFNSYTVNVSSPDVSLDANEGRNILLKAGIYVIYVVINTHNINASFLCTSSYRENWSSQRIIQYNSAWWEYDWKASVYKASGNWYMRLWINPAYQVTDLSNSLIRFVKVW